MHRGAGIMQYVLHKTNVCIVLIIPDTPGQRSSLVRAVDIVNREYNDDSSHLTYINKY